MLPDEKRLMQQLKQAINEARKKHGLAPPSDMDTDVNQFIQQQHQQHCQAAANRLNIHMIKALQQWVPRGVIHCEDHHPDRLIWFCPFLYTDCITNTFTNPTVFEVSISPPLALHEATYGKALRLRPDHRWASHNWGRMPNAYVLPKREKKFQTARPTVSFIGAMGRSLWEAFADTLQLLTRHALGHGNGTQQLQQVKQFVQHLAIQDEQHHPYGDDHICVNQDPHPSVQKVSGLVRLAFAVVPTGQPQTRHIYLDCSR